MKTIFILLVLNLLIGSCFLVNRPTAKIYSDDIYIALDGQGNVIDENHCIDSLNLAGYKVINDN
jgi:hypothetical protein